MTRDERAQLGAALAQAGAAASLGAFVASVIEPPTGARWVLVGLAVLFAAIATVLHRRGGDPSV